MIVFPGCKINLGLRVIRKREDGYHDVDTIFYPLDWQDALECIEAESFQFTSSGLAVAGEVTQNLVVRAYELLKKEFPQIPTLHIHLHKAIPMGAGLGGGSSDAAHMLTLLNETYDLHIPAQRLIAYALQLGSDCPFFIRNHACRAQGRGEIFTPVSLDVTNYQWVLIYPGIVIPTPLAFQGVSPKQPEVPLDQVIQQPIECWKQTLVNDFEPGIFYQFPVLGEIKQWLYQQGALYAAMSGSGSTLFGIFPKGKTPTKEACLAKNPNSLIYIQ